MALEWALQATEDDEPQIALDSFKLFSMLKAPYQYEMLMKTVLALFKSFVYNEREKQKLTLSILVALPPEFKQDSRSKDLMISIGSTLLQTATISQYSSALKILNSCMPFSLNQVKAKQPNKDFLSSNSFVF